jgi:Type II CAAX prenyl endopeptidase Rce1-like
VLLLATLITRVMRFDGVDMGASPVSLIGMTIGAVGEETGWRGFLHRRLNQRLDRLVSSLIVGIPWALWHIGLYQNGPLYMGLWTDAWVGDPGGASPSLPWSRVCPRCRARGPARDTDLKTTLTLTEGASAPHERRSAAFRP